MAPRYWHSVMCSPLIKSLYYQTYSQLKTKIYLFNRDSYEYECNSGLVHTSNMSIAKKRLREEEEKKIDAKRKTNKNTQEIYIYYACAKCFFFTRRTCFACVHNTQLYIYVRQNIYVCLFYVCRMASYHIHIILKEQGA